MDIPCNITFKDRIRHLFNPLHIYCRLVHFGVSKKAAMDICKAYESCLYRQTIGK
jgi:hypothetical protein